MKNFKKLSGRLNIPIIVRMLRVLNKFFTTRHEDEEAKLPQKIWAFLEKLMFYYFFVSTIVDPLRWTRGKCLQCLPL